jgi:hypothetical protein
MQEIKIDITKLNHDALFNLFTAIDNIEQYYINEVEDEEVASDMLAVKTEINNYLAQDDFKIIKIEGDWALDVLDHVIKQGEH